MSNKSIASETGSAKAKYSLFPAQSAADKKCDPLVALAMPPIVQDQRNAQVLCDTEPIQNTGNKPVHRKSRSRTVTLELRQHRASVLLGAGQYNHQCRSPAATDDMIMFNFGIMDLKGSSKSSSKALTSSDVDFESTLEFLKAPYKPTIKEPIRVPSGRRASGQSSSSVTIESAGPPPTRALPAIPTTDKQDFRISRSSQRSYYSQHSRPTSKRSIKRFTPDDPSFLERHASANGRSHTISTPSEFANSTTSGAPILPVLFSGSQVDSSKTNESRSRSRGRQKSIGR